MKRKATILGILSGCMAFVFLILPLTITHVARAQGTSNLGLNFIPVVKRADEDYELVKQIVANISGFGPRYTTYEGYERTATYIKELFKKYLEPVEGEWSQIYNITVLADYGGTLTLEDGEKIRVYPLMPNEVAPVVAKGLTGPIVYVGNGELSEMNGKKINGSIVLMDFNSNWRWLQAASLGARAVIFIEPIKTSRVEALQKRLETVSYSFPRFYVKSDDAVKLLVAIKNSEAQGKILTGTLEGRTWWENRQAENIMGLLRSPGKKIPIPGGGFLNSSDIWILIGGYYDAYSVVPSLSTGASEAVSTAITLALVKYYAEHPPPFSILFVMWSGHHQGLWGVREWTEKYIFGPDNPPDSPYYRSKSLAKSDTSDIYGIIQVDIVPDSPLLYPFPAGGAFYCEQRGPHFGNVLIYFDALKDLQAQTGVNYGLTTQGESQENVLSSCFASASERPIYSPQYIRFWDAEVLAKVGYPTPAMVRFATGRTLSVYLGIPIDTYKTIEPQLINVKSQMELLYVWLHALFWNEKYPIYKPLPAGAPPEAHWGIQSQRGDGTIRTAHTYLFHENLEVVNWNYSVGWYTPIPKYSANQTILFIWYGWGGDWTYAEEWYQGRQLCVMRANDEGKFRVIGVHSARGAGLFTARVLDDEGRVIAIDDQGQYRLPYITHTAVDAEWGIERAKDLDNYLQIAVFRCGSYIIIDYVNPDYFDRSYLPLGISARYFDGHTDVVHYNLAGGAAGNEYHSLGYSIAAAWVEADKTTELIILTGYAANRPFIIFNNSTRENPLGSGYKIRAGEQILLTLFDFARGSFNVNEPRVTTVKTLMGTQAIGEPQERTKVLLERMEQALKSYNYSEAYLLAFDAWQSARKSYNTVRGTIEDAIYTVPFFSALIIPFVFLAERVFLESRGLKRLIVTICSCVILIIFFSLLHPGFNMASSSMIVLISFAILVLLLPAIFVIGSQAGMMLTEYRRKALGAEFRGAGRFSLVSSSFSTGLGYMKRRKLRTGMTLASILMLVFATVLFTSVSGIELVKQTEYRIIAPPLYEGILIHKEYFGQLLEGYLYGMGIRLLDYLQIRYGEQAYVAPRLWVWPQHGSPPQFAQYSGFLITGPDYPEHAPYVVRALLGLTPQEEELSNVDAALVAGRWFNEADRYAIILPENVAEALGIKKEDLPVNVSLSGLEVTCVGIMGEAFNGINEMDGSPLTPIDFLVTATPPAHLFLHQIAIIPYKLWPDLDAFYQAGARPGLMISSIGIKFYNTSKTLYEAGQIFQLFPAANMQVWAFQDGRLLLLTVGTSLVSIGWREQIVPLTIVFLTILNLMLTNVIDRKREIYVLSSLGLSPSQVSFLFISEAIAYGIIGSMIGYIVAVGATRLISTVGLAIGFVNYASGWVATSIALSVLITLLSTVYPTLVASRVVTPSLERKWTIRTKPVGDEWDIPLPFTAGEEDTALGMLLFTCKYFEQHMSPTSPEFSTEIAPTLTETRIRTFKAYILQTQCRLIPYELGIRQKILLQVLEREPGHWVFELHLTRLAGDSKEWVSRNRDLVDYIRKRLLVWRGLTEAERKLYLEEAKKWKGLATT